MQKKTQKVKAMEVGVIVAIIGVVVSVITFAITTYQTRYNNKGIDAGKTVSCNYTSSSSNTVTSSIRFSKGNIRYGLMQSSGTNKMSYQVKYKKSTSSSYTVNKTMTFASNNKYYGSYFLTSTSGSTTYNLRLDKTSYKTTSSKVTWDLMLE